MAPERTPPPRTTKPSTPRPDTILRLVTGAPRTLGLVDIDGTAYAMSDPGHFSLRDAGGIQRNMERILALEAKANPTARDETEYRAALTALARRVVPDAPAEAWAGMGNGDLADLAVAFFGQVAMRNPQLAAYRLTAAATPPPPGTTPSRRSPGSTDPPPSAGATG